MSWIDIPCRNPTCRTSFTVDEGVASRPCHKCGTDHRAPWEQHDPRLQVPDENHPPELVCERCFTEFDVRREPSCKFQKNTFRCPKCGKDHAPPATLGTDTGAAERIDAGADPQLAEPVAADGGAVPSEVIDDLPAAFEGRDGGDGDVHVHFHINQD